jgi:hypothetical protein
MLCEDQCCRCNLCSSLSEGKLFCEGCLFDEKKISLFRIQGWFMRCLAYELRLLCSRFEPERWISKKLLSMLFTRTCTAQYSELPLLSEKFGVLAPFHMDSNWDPFTFPLQKSKLLDLLSAILSYQEEVRHVKKAVASLTRTTFNDAVYPSTNCCERLEKLTTKSFRKTCIYDVPAIRRQCNRIMEEMLKSKEEVLKDQHMPAEQITEKLRHFSHVKEFEIHELVSGYSLANYKLELKSAQELLFCSWKEVVVVGIRFLHFLADRDNVGALYEFLHGVLLHIRSSPIGSFSTALSSIVLRSSNKLRELHTRTPFERLSDLFTATVDCICSTSTDSRDSQKTRFYLYSSLLVYLRMPGDHHPSIHELLKGVDLKALLPLVIADSLKGNMTTVAITLRFLDALLQAEGEQAIGEPGATASPCLKFLADRGAISQLVHSLDLEDNLTCDTLVKSSESVNALAVLEGKLSFLTSVAQSVRGAHALLHSGIIGRLSPSFLFGNTSGPAFGDTAHAENPHSRVCTQVFRLLSTIQTTLSTRNHEVCHAIGSFVRKKYQDIIRTLKEFSETNLTPLYQISLLTGLLYYAVLAQCEGMVGLMECEEIAGLLTSLAENVIY